MRNMEAKVLQLSESLQQMFLSSSGPLLKTFYFRSSLLNPGLCLLVQVMPLIQLCSISAFPQPDYSLLPILPLGLMGEIHYQNGCCVVLRHLIFNQARCSQQSSCILYLGENVKDFFIIQWLVCWMVTSRGLWSMA